MTVLFYRHRHIIFSIVNVPHQVVAEFAEGTDESVVDASSTSFEDILFRWEFSERGQGLSEVKTILSGLWSEIRRATHMNGDMRTIPRSR